MHGLFSPFVEKHSTGSSFSRQRPEEGSAEAGGDRANQRKTHVHQRHKENAYGWQDNSCSNITGSAEVPVDEANGRILFYLTSFWGTFFSAVSCSLCSFPEKVLFSTMKYY